ncbi:MAG: response regulator [Nitrospirae bacterium]|nr:MAG: response regulator [Nitrospirota bacterium]
MSKTKVLIVDDEEEFSNTLAERLCFRGFDAVSVGNADKAIAAIRNDWVPDVALLDLKMPGLSGLDTLEMIKKLDLGIEAIMITGHGSTASGIEGMKRGLFDYLMKPVDINELVAKINEAAKKNYDKT